MDTTNFSEGQYITPKVVTESPQKICVVVTEAKPIVTKYGEQLSCEVQFNQQRKIWNLNRDSVKNLATTFGKDSINWIGKKVQFTVISVAGKDRIVGTGLLD
jgi:hypothetical protein